MSLNSIVIVPVGSSPMPPIINPRCLPVREHAAGACTPGPLRSRPRLTGTAATENPDDMAQGGLFCTHADPAQGGTWALQR